jgi:hypothetical protein
MLHITNAQRQRRYRARRDAGYRIYRLPLHRRAVDLLIDERAIPEKDADDPDRIGEHCAALIMRWLARSYR